MMPLLILLAGVGLGLVPVLASSPHQNGGQAAGPNGLQCQRIAVSACQGLGYNMTALPNLAGHTNQLEAELQVRNPERRPRELARLEVAVAIPAFR